MLAKSQYNKADVEKPHNIERSSKNGYLALEN